MSCCLLNTANQLRRERSDNNQFYLISLILRLQLKLMKFSSVPMKLCQDSNNENHNFNLTPFLPSKSSMNLLPRLITFQCMHSSIYLRFLTSPRNQFKKNVCDTSASSKFFSFFSCSEDEEKQFSLLRHKLNNWK